MNTKQKIRQHYKLKCNIKMLRVKFTERLSPVCQLQFTAIALAELGLQTVVDRVLSFGNWKSWNHNERAVVTVAIKFAIILSSVTPANQCKIAFGRAAVCSVALMNNVAPLPATSYPAFNFAFCMKNLNLNDALSSGKKNESLSASLWMMS